MKKLLSVFTALIVTLSALALSVSAASPKLSRTSADLPAGYAVTLKVSNASDTVKWSVSDSSVITVKSTGENSAKVSAKKTGTAYVYAKTGDKTLKCKINVKQSVISASSGSVTMEKGKSKTVTLTVKGSKTILAQPDDPAVCSVVWGKKWDGDKITLTINAKKNGTAKIKLYNKNDPDSTMKTISVTVGKTTAASKTALTAGGSKDTENTDASDTSAMIEKVAELVNKERKAAGKTELTLDDKLNQVAAIRAEEISKSFSHTRPDGSSCFTAFDEVEVVNASKGENLAEWQKSPEEAMESWMNSSGHKANILSDDFTKIGVGCYLYNGKYYWVQEFQGDAIPLK